MTRLTIKSTLHAKMLIASQINGLQTALSLKLLSKTGDVKKADTPLLAFAMWPSRWVRGAQRSGCQQHPPDLGANRRYQCNLFELLQLEMRPSAVSRLQQQFCQVEAEARG